MGENTFKLDLKPWFWWVVLLLQQGGGAGAGRAALGAAEL